MSKHSYSCIDALQSAGISYDDAVALRRISMTLHRWHELECGVDHGAIEREGPRGGGKPRWRYPDGRDGGYVADREAGALKRLGKIMCAYVGFGYYVQGDPRGAPLYILPPKLASREPGWIDANYNQGIAVYR